MKVPVPQFIPLEKAQAQNKKIVIVNLANAPTPNSLLIHWAFPPIPCQHIHTTSFQGSGVTQSKTDTLRDFIGSFASSIEVR